PAPWTPSRRLSFDRGAIARLHRTDLLRPSGLALEPPEPPAITTPAPLGGPSRRAPSGAAATSPDRRPGQGSEAPADPSAVRRTAAASPRRRPPARPPRRSRSPPGPRTARSPRGRATASEAERAASTRSNARAPGREAP